MMMMSECLLLLCCLLLLLLRFLFRRPPGFPPGPPRLPLVGSLPFAVGGGKKPSLFHGSRDLVRKYGKVRSEGRLN